MEGDQGNFWKKIGHGMKPEVNRCAARIGESINDHDIMTVWKDHFGSIINGESPDKREKECCLFMDALKKKMSNCKLPWWCLEVHFKEVDKEFQMLKLNKSAGPDGLQPEHLKYGGALLALYMSVGFTAMVRQSYVPQQFLKSFIVLYRASKTKRGLYLIQITIVVLPYRL